MNTETLLIVTTSLLFAWIGVILVWERVAPYRPGLPLLREGFWVDLVWYTLIQSYILKIVIFDYLIAPLQHSLTNVPLPSVGQWPIWGQVLFFVITHDLYIYWFHRWQHSNRWLWRTHEAHHSNKQVDFLAGSRSHVIEIIINQTIEFAPILLLGADPAVVPIKALLDAMFGLFIHANIRVRLGVLHYILGNPTLHLWHHANHREVFHANFATKFSFWDYLFGTVYNPGHTPGNQPSDWGLSYDFPKDYFLQHIFSVVRFSERALLRYRWFASYYYLRPTLMRWMATPWTQQPDQPMPVPVQPSATPAHPESATV